MGRDGAQDGSAARAREGDALGCGQSARGLGTRTMGGMEARDDLRAPPAV